MFTVVRNVLLNPLPYRDPAQLFSIYEHENWQTGNAYMPVAAGTLLSGSGPRSASRR